jgi:hypothetical protein
MCRLFAILALALGLVGLPALAPTVLADKRVALVIGNAAYQHTPKLNNATRDANAMASLFKKAGFEVVLEQTDVGNLEFKRSLRNFLLAVQDADIAVLFYSGHGIQLGEQNYMVPVDAKLAREYDAKDEAISLERIVEALEPAKRLRLVILDACRENPFVVNMKQRVATRGLSRGLAPVGPTGVDTLIAYAAKAGSTASDGDDGHSPYTKALLKHIAEPGLDIRLAFGRVRDDVLNQTGNEQEPFVYGSLGGSILSLVQAPTIARDTPLGDISADYNLVEKINSKMAWEVFINTHKTGILVDVARKRLQQLEQEQKLAALPPVQEPAKPSAAEIRAWNKVKDSRDRNAISNFIKTYESSPLAAKAREALDELNRIERENEQKALAEREAARQREEAERQRLEREAAALKEAERKRLERLREAELEAERKRQAEAERQRVEREAALAKAGREKAEADRKKAEQEAALAKAAEAEAERRRQAEADRKKGEQQAALAKAAREKAEAERQKAEREAELARAAEAEAEAKRQAEAKRLETERLAALAKEAERKRQEEACSREQKAITRLEASLKEASARQELDKLAHTLSCEDLRPSLLALSAEALRLKELEARQAADQIRAAQRELRRIGCYSGSEDGVLSKTTKDAIQLYRTRSKQKITGLNVTEELLTELKGAPIDRCAEASKVQQARPEKGKQITPRQESAEPRTQTKVGRPSGPGVMTGVGF